MIGLFKENTKIALDSIKSQALRTSLTVLIIAIGIWALVGVLTLVTALENSLLNNFAIDLYCKDAIKSKSKSHYIS